MTPAVGTTHVERRLAKAITYVLKGSAARVTDNRKHGFKRGVQTFTNTLFRRDLVLQKLLIGFNLNGEQISDIHRPCQLAEILSNTLFLCMNRPLMPPGQILIPLSSAQGMKLQAAGRQNCRQPFCF